VAAAIQSSGELGPGPGSSLAERHLNQF